MTACPKCFLPREDYAWQCDGCGYELRQDYDTIRAELRAQLQRGRVAFVVGLIVSFAIVGGLVWLAMHGAIFISVPLGVGIAGYLHHAAHKISILRGHLELLERRHPALPRATAHPSGG